MKSESPGKVQARHLRRHAYLYVRQSTLRQVLENTESTKRQYALKQRAMALGWSSEAIIVIDADLGQSAASASDRVGFQKLVGEVSLGHVGLVMGLEVSRLARNSTDWHRLLEISALTDTLILDEDGIYDPAHFNDRLLLGLKGTMSEAELHVLRARLQGGILNKARRGELRSRLPIGFVYDDEGRVALEPDQEIQGAMRLFFQTFRRTGSASATVKAFRELGVRFPSRPYREGGKVLWGELRHSTALRLLHNPRYAGAFFYGSSRQRKHDGRLLLERLPRDEWTSLIPDAHAGYITWEEFEENLRRLRENAAANGSDRRKSPAREGPALLQGVAICGKCGDRMTVRYLHRKDRLVPQYVCQRAGIERSEPICQSILGRTIDRAVGDLLVDAISPMAIEAAMAVQRELQERFEEADALRRKGLERCQYEAEHARRRYMRVDPDNRLVAASLEAQWNEKLRAVSEAEDNYERQRQQDRQILDERTQQELHALCTDVPRLWRSPATPDRERKRMLRLLIEDVTLRKEQEIVVQVRFRAGATESFKLPVPLPSWKLHETNPEVIAAIDCLLEHHTEGEIASLLNQRGYRSGTGKAFHRLMVRRLREQYKLRSRYERLREQGLRTQAETAVELGIHYTTVHDWRRRGLLKGVAYDDKRCYLYELTAENRPSKQQGVRIGSRLQDHALPSK